MAEQSLRELKAQNAAEQDENIEQEEVEQPEPDEVDEPEQHDTTDIDESEPDDSEDEDKTEEAESWMQEGDEADPKESKGFKPSPEAAAVRKKLRAKLSEKDDELEQLKQKLAQLESGQQQQAPAQQQQLPPRPKLEDFDYDEDKHNAALDEWYDKKAEAKAAQVYQSSQSEAQKREQAERQKRELDDALEGHYTRATQLILDGKVSEERFAQAEQVVTQTLDSLYQGNGAQVAQSLIKSLGEGSEKVMYQLGVNSAKREEFMNTLKADPSGMSAAVFLGRLQNSIASPSKRKSTAPKPTPDVKGDAGGTSRAEKLRRQYQNASDVQTRITLKRAAKRKGIDVTNW